MEKELLKKEIGSEGELEIVIEDAKVYLNLGYDGKGAGAKVGVYVSAEYFLDKLAAAIPSRLDDAIIELIKGAMKE